MLSQFLQFLFSGLTIGATYAAAAIGFALVYNASGVINFAQGEFMMIGGMAAFYFVQAGVALPLAIVLAIATAAAVGMVVEKLAIEPAANSGVVTVIIITIGASLTLRGLVQVLLGKGTHALPSFSGDKPLSVLGATLLPQNLWILGCTAVVVLALAWFFGRTRTGKAMVATSCNPLAASLVGIDTRFILFLAFGLSSAVGAIGGVLVAPISYTSYDVGIMLGLKGFVAATLGGLGSGIGAIVGGLLVGLAEAMTAGYLSSAYKDATSFVLILLILFLMPQGLFGKKASDRV
jgi:branched-chain amino acid transport system permease protein